MNQKRYQDDQHNNFNKLSKSKTLESINEAKISTDQAWTINGELKVILYICFL